MNPTEFIETAGQRYLTDALFAARVKMVVDLVEQEVDVDYMTPTNLVTLAACCGLHVASIGVDGKQTTPEVDYNLTYALGLEFAAKEVRRKSRFAYGRGHHDSVEDLLDVEEALTAIVATLRSTNARLLAEQPVRPTAQEKN